ncbi:MAG TPA: endonuclease domain-containing protein [Streptosporangiaceae bacterium]|nr:endonuclease domain-containing protein [Streptosporangiaceae bacterium]
MGLTPERLGQMLETQECACAMCRTPFEEDQRICIDHDHAWLPAHHAEQVLREVRATSKARTRFIMEVPPPGMGGFSATVA